MPVKLRLQRQGRKKISFYHIVATDSRAAGNGKHIEKVGSYNPLTNPATVELDSNKALDWLMKGAVPTPTVKAILTYKGVMYKKHLLRGVKLGKLKAEEVDAKFEQWFAEHTVRINTKKEKIHNTRKDKIQAKFTAEAKKREEKEKLREQRKAEALAAAAEAEAAKAAAEQAATPTAETISEVETPNVVAEQPTLPTAEAATEVETTNATTEQPAPPPAEEVKGEPSAPESNV